MSVVVVNLGLPKTGTTTLARALRRSGLRTADHRILPRQTADETLHHAFVGDLVYKGYFETGDPLHYFAGFGALTEISLLKPDRSLWPQTDLALIRAMRQHHPGLKFLASSRDPFKLSQSMLAWANLGTERLPQSAVPGLPQGYGETTKERMQWIRGHYETLRDAFRGDPDFLEYDIGDDDIRARLERFLGRDLPWWGKSNQNKLMQES